MTYNKIKILFIGTVDFSYQALESLIDNDYDVVGLITKRASKFNADYRDLTPLASANEIPIFYRDNNNSEELVTFIKNKKPDVIYCFGWSHILNSDILSIPSYGVVGFHPAALPNNRGRHPIIWALFLGLKETASTFFIMDEGADTGDIISQQKIEIDNDDALSLYNKIIKTGLKQILSFTSDLNENKGEITKIPQDKNEGNSWRKRGKSDGRIDFRMTSQAISNLVKALTHPYIGAHVECEQGDVNIWSVNIEKTEFNNYEPGKVIEVLGSDILVKTYNGVIRITNHDFDIPPIKGSYL